MHILDLINAVNDRDGYKIKILIQNGIDVNCVYNGKSALYISIFNTAVSILYSGSTYSVYDAQIIKILLDNRARVFDAERILYLGTSREPDILINTMHSIINVINEKYGRCDNIVKYITRAHRV